MFSGEHLDLMRLARTALHHPYPGGKGPVLGLVARAVAGDLEGALEFARGYLDQVRLERDQAEAAALLLQRWAEGDDPTSTSRPLRIGQMAKLLGVTTDALRNWERNGLIEVPKEPSNGYRLYGSAQINRLRVLRVLRSAGYSVMAILRMLRYLDGGGQGDLRRQLDTPNLDEDALYWTDRWLSTLTEQEQRAAEVISQLEKMVSKKRG
jgi:DNA-binding transcriptional MerR regulator